MPRAAREPQRSRAFREHVESFKKHNAVHEARSHRVEFFIDFRCKQTVHEQTRTSDRLRPPCSCLVLNHLSGSCFMYMALPEAIPGGYPLTAKRSIRGNDQRSHPALSSFGLPWPKRLLHVPATPSLWEVPVPACCLRTLLRRDGG